MLRKVSEKNAEALTQHAAASALDMASLVDPGLPYADLISDTIDGAKLPDWNLLDQYFQFPSTETPDVAGWNGDESFPSLFLDLE
jgi:hypothetical protein